MRHSGFAVLLAVVLAACSGGSGSAHEATFAVRGTLRVVGGPAPGVDNPTPGRVRALTVGGHVVVTVDTSTNGSFVLRVPKGRYVLKGNADFARRYGYTCGGSTIHVGRSSIPRVAVICAIS